MLRLSPGMGALPAGTAAASTLEASPSSSSSEVEMLNLCFRLSLETFLWSRSRRPRPRNRRVRSARSSLWTETAMEEAEERMSRKMSEKHSGLS